jgi:hypothetical protein
MTKVFDNSTIFLGVYGSIKPHPWLSVDPSEETAAGLLVSRSIAMGWASYGGDARALDSWQVSEAELEQPHGLSTRIAWYQVTLGSRNEPLPVQQLFAGVDHSLQRIGEVELDAVQIMLPLRRAGDAMSRLSGSLEWFSVCDPGSPVAVRLTVDTSRNDGSRDFPSKILAFMTDRDILPFSVASVTLDETAIVNPQPPAPDDRWTGPNWYRPTYSLVMPEWSFDAVAWILSMVAEVSRRQGLGAVLLSLEKR